MLLKTIDVYIDFTCPFCYLGGERLIKLMEKHEKSLTDIRFRSLQLEPNDLTEPVDFFETRSKAYGYTPQGSKDYFKERFGPEGKPLGIDFNVESIIAINTIHAHMGLQYATLFGKQVPYFKKVMAAHFEKGQNYYDFDVIDAILEDLGLDTHDFHQRESEMKQLVQEDVTLARGMNINSVPTFYRDRILMVGAPGMDELERALF